MMKVVLLAGGLGSRLSEETGLRPKPMVEIGGRPILWHIMKTYSQYGFNEFVILTGYKSHVIKEYFINYYSRYSDITVDMQANSVEIHKTRTEPWKVTMLYTGQDTLTGGRLKKAQHYLQEAPFMLTYGDGVANIDIPALVKQHQATGKLATMSVVQPTGRFGSVGMDATGSIHAFEEKPTAGGAWINGGYFVLEPGIFEYLPEGDNVIWERSPLENLAKAGQLHAYQHHGFWQPMDTLKDKNELTDLWMSGQAPWKVWAD